MLARGILGSGRTGSVSSRPFLNSSGWWWLISSVFLIRISCHKTTHANSYYGAWPGWAVSISVLPLTLLPPIPRSIKVFSNESTLRMWWPKYWSFSFSISPSSGHPGLISFRMDWLDLLAVQGTLKSLLQHHSSKASNFQCSAFFTVQFSHLYMTTGKTIALTRWIFVGKVMSLLFNMLSRLVITFLPMSKHLNFMAAITICSDFGAKKNKG